MTKFHLICWFLINLVLVKRAISNIFPQYHSELEHSLEGGSATTDLATQPDFLGLPSLYQSGQFIGHSLPDQHVSKRARYNDVGPSSLLNNVHLDNPAVGKKPHIHPEQAFQIPDYREQGISASPWILEASNTYHSHISDAPPGMNSSPDLTASTSQDSRPVSSENAVSNELDVGDYGEIEEMIVLDKSHHLHHHNPDKSSNIIISAPPPLFKCPFNYHQIIVPDHLVQKNCELFESEIAKYKKFLASDSSTFKTIVLDRQRPADRRRKGRSVKVVPLLNSFTLETTLKRSFNELNKFLVFINTCLLKTLNQKYIHGEMMIQANDDLQEWIFKIIFYPDYGKAIITEYKPTASINMDTDFLLEVRRNQNQNQNQIQSLIVGFLRDGPTQDFQKKFRDTITIIGIYYKQELPDLWKNSFENNDFSFWLILQRSIELAKIENLDLNQILTISASGGTIINSLSFLSNQPIQSKISQFTERIQGIYDSIVWKTRGHNRIDLQDFPVTLLTGQIKNELYYSLRLVQLIRIKSDRKLIEPQIAIRKLEILLNSLHNLHTTLLTYLNKNNLEIFPNALDTFLEWFSRAIFDYTSESLPVFGYSRHVVLHGELDKSVFGFVQQQVIKFISNSTIDDYPKTTYNILAFWYHNFNPEYCITHFGSVDNFLAHFSSSLVIYKDHLSHKRPFN
ncbi:hypothetical protein MJO28_007740 [Puccinia striiformis f. sp. tritici]|uniref:Uncharacterized protein n=1 Tax=Puccinia striiformis f. sp. tritici TaxID=168172 RepID=A0ACC0EFF7_9BASI|nr:hypothetical protein Pst134EA_013839 [Puccinia striiformis f. sp. tritici]KAH9465985.1 hypothetical protein Pst134EA_013839 [Puccinia striiformis f. sp. tritici]KAI7952056.1 hypothetical protein MJO28_007740 [Puccinia striiformis f. sp. tritici]